MAPRLGFGKQQRAGRGRRGGTRMGGILMGGIMLLTAVPPLCHGAAHGGLSATVPFCIDMSPLSTRRIVGLSLYYPRLPIIPFPSAPYIHSHLPLIPFSPAPYSFLVYPLY